MRKHQRLNSYHQELANRAASRQHKPVERKQTLSNVFWAEYYRLSSERVIDKTPRFEDALMAYLCYRLAMAEDSVVGMIHEMLAEGITHRDPQGEAISSVLSGGI